jgi:putative ABC transport system substrate-binding protein
LKAKTSRLITVPLLRISICYGNMRRTGISILATELDGKRQDILIEAVPGIRRMAALADSSTLTEAKARALQEAARAHKVELSIYRITRAEDCSDYR